MDDPKNLAGSPLNPEQPNTQPAESEHDAEPEPEPTLTQWFARNGIVILLFGALFVYLFSTDGFWGLWNLLKVVLGLGFVIFIHELGHFLVAKWCDVHVTTFSIGFGPAIPGCKHKWGETTYMIGIIPLGGYVQMVGQVDLDETGDGTEEDPRSYKNKTVWQRMAIISAGVIMNAILAMVCFAIVFMVGKEQLGAVVDMTDAGSVAFTNGIRTGSEILQIGSVKEPYFDDLLETVLSSVENEPIEFVYRLPGKEPVTLEIEPIVSADGGRPLIGVSPPRRLQFAEQRLARGVYKSPAYPGSAAAKATPAFAFGDAVVATTDPANPSQVTDLPRDPRNKKTELRDFFEFARRMEQLAGKEVTIRVQHKSTDKTTETDIKVPPAFTRALGARMQMGQVTAIRKNSPAEKELQLRDKNLEGDLIEAVMVKDAAGKEIIFTDKTREQEDGKIYKILDPVRLPFELERWADELYAKKKTPTLDDKTVRLQVRRHQKKGDQQYIKADAKLVWDQDWRFDRVQPFSKTSPLAIPELGFAYQVNTVVADADSASKLQPGDIIKEIRYYVIGDDGVEKADSWGALDKDQWASTFVSLQSPGVANKLDVKVERAKKEVIVELATAEDKDWPKIERGFLFSPDIRIQKAKNVFGAVALGFEGTHKRMLSVFRNIRGIATGRISATNLAGPISIARIAYRFADYDFWEFLFLIGMISVNLAVINFLPIPVLDGGHMVFLIYEKVRGKPASEGVRVAATYAGLALILLLMVFVFYLDIKRLIMPGS